MCRISKSIFSPEPRLYPDPVNVVSIDPIHVREQSLKTDRRRACGTKAGPEGREFSRCTSGSSSSLSRTKMGSGCIFRGFALQPKYSISGSKESASRISGGAMAKVLTSRVCDKKRYRCVFSWRYCMHKQDVSIFVTHNNIATRLLWRPYHPS